MNRCVAGIVFFVSLAGALPVYLCALFVASCIEDAHAKPDAAGVAVVEYKTDDYAGFDIQVRYSEKRLEKSPDAVRRALEAALAAVERRGVEGGIVAAVKGEDGKAIGKVVVDVPQDQP